MTDNRVRRYSAIAFVALAIVAIAFAVRTSKSHPRTPIEGLVGKKRHCDPELKGLPCSEVVLSNRTIRYVALDRQGDTKAAVVVDLGGPGVALPASRLALAMLRAEIPADMRMIVLEEPWATHPVSELCRTALSRFYVALTRAQERRARASIELSRNCQLMGGGRPWGWTPASYREAVEAVADAERVQLRGIIAVSFGALRTARLWAGETSVDWVVLASPAGFDLSGKRYMMARQASANAALLRGCKACSKPREERTQLLRLRLDLERRPVRVSGRTPSVRGADLDAAVLEAAYLSEGERAQFVGRLLDRRAGTFRQIGELSDRLLLRYGEYDIAPSFLAYLAEVCRAYQPWPDSNADVGSLIEALHAPCQAERARSREALGERPSARLCIAYATHDDIVPVEEQRRWFRRFPLAVKRGGGEMHGDLAAVSSCVREVVN